MIINKIVKNLPIEQQEVFCKLTQKDGILENVEFKPLPYNQYFDSSPMIDTLKSTCVTKIYTEELLISLEKNLIKKFLQSAANNNKIIDFETKTNGYILLAVNRKKIVAYFQEELTKKQGLLHIQPIYPNSYDEDYFNPHYISNFFVKCDENAVSAMVNITTTPTEKQIEELFFSCRAFNQNMVLIANPHLIYDLKKVYPQYNYLANYSCPSDLLYC